MRIRPCPKSSTQAFAAPPVPDYASLHPATFPILDSLLSSNPHKSAHFPSKEDVLAFIAQEGGDVGTREIARAFGLKNADRAALKKCCATSPSGEGREAPPQAAPRRRSSQVVLCDLPPRCRRRVDRVPAEWDEEVQGEPPRIHVHVRAVLSPAMCGVGDRALLRTERSATPRWHSLPGPRHQGDRRARHRVLGVFRRLADGSGRWSRSTRNAPAASLRSLRGATLMPRKVTSFPSR